jgi:predicted GNAT family N-acyltransferase
MDKMLASDPSKIFALSRRDDYDPALQSVHGNIYPEDIRPPDRVVARLRLRGRSDELENVRVWRLSPLGVELLVEEPHPYYKATPIDLELVIAGQRSAFEGLVVDVVSQTAGNSILGIRLVKKATVRGYSENRRVSDRWLCADDFLPTCIAPTPGRLDDFIYFKIRDFSSKGLQLTCSLRNKFLVPGMQLSVTVVFPMAQTAQFSIEIQRVSIGSFEGRDRVVVGATYSKLSKLAKAIIGQYLIQFSNVQTLEELREADLVPERVSLGIDFHNVRSETDYFSVLELRHLAHEQDGNLKDGVGKEELADIYDARSRLIIGKYRGTVVATARVRFPSSQEDQESPTGFFWGKALPRQDLAIEVSRVATHPGFRRSDLLAALFRYSYLTTVQSDRPWVVMSCLDKMSSFYQRLGFKSTGIRYNEEFWRDDRTLNIMVANVADLVLGKNVSPMYWNFVWRKVAEHYIENNLIALTGVDRARLFFYRSLGLLGMGILRSLASAFRMRLSSSKIK